MQAFISGINASGVVACCLRLFTKYFFEKLDHGLRKGACMFFLFIFLCIFRILKGAYIVIINLHIFIHISLTHTSLTTSTAHVFCNIILSDSNILYISLLKVISWCL
jgi:equilibrative nucleoside transporter 1/2/3